MKVYYWRTQLKYPDAIDICFEYKEIELNWDKYE